MTGPDKNMEHKTWLWRRKSSEKTHDKSDLQFVENEEKKEKALILERSLKELTEQLSSVRAEYNVKDSLIAKQAKVAEEAIAGWEKAEAEAESFKQELNYAILQKEAAEERVVNIDAALKDCLQQLNILKDDNQHIINDAAMKISREQENSRALEYSLADTNKKLTKFSVEYGKLSRMLEVKEKLIEDLSEAKSQSEANFNAAMERLESSEKDNASLKYEVCMLQKELEIRNQDRDFNLKSADAAHRQHLESIKKISKLELECQRLRVMVRKRLPGPAALAKMKSEVEMLGNGITDSRRRKSNYATDSVPENGYDASNRRVSSLVERLRAIDDENKILKEILSKKNSELQSSRIMFARTLSKLTQAEKQLEELSKGHSCLEFARSSPVTYDLPLASISEDGGNEDNISCAESWASALISELEHFRNGKPTTPSSRTGAASDLSLMDDFVEMEKLAIFCVDKPSGSSKSIPGQEITSVAQKECVSKLDPLESTGKELVPIDSISEFSETNTEFQSSYIQFEKYPSWLQDILRVIIQKHHITQKSLDVILEDVRVALQKLWHPPVDKNFSASMCVGNISHKDQYTSHSPGGVIGGALQNETNNLLFQSNLEKSLCRLTELIGGMIQRYVANNNGQHGSFETDGSTSSQSLSASPTGHVAHVFLWEVSELSSVLQHFIVVCNDLSCGKADLEKFVSELTSTFDWIVGHSFSLQDASMKETVKKLYFGDESYSDNKFETEINSLGTESDRTESSEKLKLRIGRSLPTSNGLCIFPKMEEESTSKKENRMVIHETSKLESTKKDMEESLKSASDRKESLATQLQKSNQQISNLQAELDSLKQSKGFIGNQIDNQKPVTEDLSTQLSVAKVELKETCQKFSSLDVEVEDKGNCCEELEAAHTELQLQLESHTAKETPKHDLGVEDKQLRTITFQDWEISAASEKLAECQATILNLGKQLKALASPKDAPLFDKVISSPSAVAVNRHSRLLDQMQAEEGAAFEDLKSPKTKEIICSEPIQPITATSPENPNAGVLNGWNIHKNQAFDNSVESISHPAPVKPPVMSYKLAGPSRHKSETELGTLVLAPKRHKGGMSFLKKLLSRRRNENSRKLALPIGS